MRRPYTEIDFTKHVVLQGVAIGTALEVVVGKQKIISNALKGATLGFSAGILVDFLARVTGYSQQYVASKNAKDLKLLQQEVALGISQMLADKGVPSDCQTIWQEIACLSYEETCDLLYYVQNPQAPTQQIEQACAKVVLMHKIETQMPYLFNLIQTKT